MASALRSLQPLLKLAHPLQKSRFFSSGISHKLFIGGLSWSIDEHSLRDAFSSYGEISEVKVVQDRETGRSKGFGFVSFMSTEDAESAKNSMDGKNLNGRNVRVDFAIEKPPSARTFGGFGATYSESTFNGNASQSHHSVSVSSTSSSLDTTFTQASRGSFETSSRGITFKSEEDNVSSGNMGTDSDRASASRVFSSTFKTSFGKNSLENDIDDVFGDDVYPGRSLGDHLGESSLAFDDTAGNIIEDDSLEEYEGNERKY